jgi:hypothetical protein
VDANSRNIEHFYELQRLTEETESVPVEEFLTRASTVLYLIALGRRAEQDPSTTQQHIDALIAIMPEDVLMVAALTAQDLLGE